MLVLGAIAGPSTGWLYVGRLGTAALTAGTRLVGGLLAARALDDRPGRGGALPTLGVVMFVTATLIDWIGPAASLPGPSQATVVPAVQSGRRRAVARRRVLSAPGCRALAPPRRAADGDRVHR